VKGESKVCDLGYSVVSEDVGNFEISVDDILRGEVLQPPEDVGNDAGGLPLLEPGFLLDLGLEVALVAQLGDDVAVAIAGEDLEAAQDVGMVHFLEHFDLGEEELL
jgi:hypothetical protein